MIKKRGILIVVLLLLAVFTLAETSPSTPTKSPPKYQAVRAEANCDDPNECTSKNAGLVQYCSSIEGCKKASCDEQDGKELPKSNSASAGCYLVAFEEDSGYDDCGWVAVAPGTTFNDQGKFADSFGLSCMNEDNIILGAICIIPTPINPNLNSAVNYQILDFDTDDLEANFFNAKLNYLNGKGIICAEDRSWYQCDQDVVGQIKWVGPTLYECTKILYESGNVKGYIWNQKDVDADHDGYTQSEGDCQDKPEEGSSCPLIDLSKYNILSQKQIREAIHKDYCSNPVYYHCSVCLNPGSTEICGDNINNDCGLGKEDAKNLQGVTSDDCNKNAAACRQENGQNNVLNEPLSYIKTGPNNGFCCGFQGITDLGKVVESDQGNFICLSRDQNLVGGVESFTGWGPGPLSGEQTAKSDCAWCLVSATTNPFKIFTIKKPGETPFDIVSNSDQWSVCSAATTTLNQPSSQGEQDNLKLARRFQCYQQGQQWNWAECYGPDLKKSNDNLKGRYAGEGLFSLPLGQPELSGETIEINVKSGQYGLFYGDAPLDFSGYTTLEFFVKYVDPGNLKLPTQLQLEIQGPSTEKGTITYYKGDVLGFAQNGFFSKDRFMHIKVPIGEFKGVERLRIISLPEQNKIHLKNIFLSKDGKTSFCSGLDSRDYNNWLTNLDLGNQEQSVATTEELCKAHYGADAWLGNDDQVDTPAASCCGNTDHEYYAGSSAKNVGCWNSQPLAKGNTSMNIQFTIKSLVKNYNVNYLSQTAQYSVSLDATTIPTKSTIPLTFSGGPQKIDQFIINKNDHFVSGDYQGKITLNNNNPSVKLYFYDPLQNLRWDDSFTVKDLLNPYENTIFLMADYHTVDPVLTEKTQEVNVDYTCAQEECLFPLLGMAPYTITNPHPDLYELYFVTGSKKEDEHFIGSGPTSFDQLANLKVKTVAQQIIYDGKNFFGCQAASFLLAADKLKPENNLNYCAIKEGKFCSYSTTIAAKKEQVITINSWSKEPLIEVGYAGVEQLTIDEVPNAVLNLKKLEKPIPPDQRNHSSLIVPGRNILSNAAFVLAGSELSSWEILSDGAPKKKESDNILGNLIKLSPTEILRSQKIALPPGDYHYAQQGTCTPQIFFVDKDGQQIIIVPPSFSVTQPGYLRLEFKGDCELQQPMLQRLDGEEPLPYTFTSQDLSRSGAACCSQDSCWNGYICVQEMSALTSFYEPTGEDRHYRCIDGQWRNVPAGKDWNGQKSGFCGSPTQCFVLSEDAGAKKGNTAASFTQGAYPLCINDGEYILDNYCDKGNWTTRTRYLAGALQEAALNDDYVLYCTKYTDNLPSLDGKEKYIAGANSLILKEAVPLGEVIAGKAQKMIQTCFPEIQQGEGKRLAPDNNCINNVCLLQRKIGSTWKTAFATTLNQPLTDTQQSFLLALNIPPNQIKCPSGEGFVACNVPGVFYSQPLNALIYTKNEFSLTASPLDKVKNLFTKFFSGSGASSSLSLGNFSKFRDVYIVKKGNKEIFAIKETTPQQAKIHAEFKNFATPICTYTQNVAQEGFSLELLQKVSGDQKIICTAKDNLQIIDATTSTYGIDLLWPQLTGRLRTE